MLRFEKKWRPTADGRAGRRKKRKLILIRPFNPSTLLLMIVTRPARDVTRRA